MNNYEEQKNRYVELKDLATDTKQALEKYRDFLNKNFGDDLEFIDIDKNTVMNGLEGMDEAIAILNRIKNAIDENYFSKNSLVECVIRACENLKEDQK